MLIDVIDKMTLQFGCIPILMRNIQLKENGYDKDEFSIVALLLEGVNKLTKIFLSGETLLHKAGWKQVQTAETSHYVTINLFANLIGVKIGKDVDVLPNFDCDVPSSERIRFISSKIFAYPETGKVEV